MWDGDRYLYCDEGGRLPPELFFCAKNEERAGRDPMAPDTIASIVLLALGVTLALVVIITLLCGYSPAEPRTPAIATSAEPQMTSTPTDGTAPVPE
jgi:hypothetical protein